MGRKRGPSGSAKRRGERGQGGGETLGVADHRRASKEKGRTEQEGGAGVKNARVKDAGSCDFDLTKKCTESGKKRVGKRTIRRGKREVKS